MKSEDRSFLEEKRQEIDKIDEEILGLLTKRFKVVDLIGRYKKEKKLPVLQQDRIDYIIKKVRIIAEKNEINPEYFEKIYKSIIDASCRLENEK